MGTSNFHNVNAKKIYACMTNDAENDYQSYDYEDLRENVYNMMEKYQECDFHTNSDNQRSMHELRSFCSHYIGSFVSNRYIRDICYVEVQINAFSRCGYYDGINLDYEIKVFINGYEQDEQWKNIFPMLRFTIKWNILTKVWQKSFIAKLKNGLILKLVE